MLALLTLAASLLAVAAPAASPPQPSPQRILGLIRAAFRSHRPPPPYVTYTLARAQLTDTGFPDYVGSYTYHIWCRTSDRAALGRKVFRDVARGPLEFMRPAFNEPRDPGPPTADVFEPAPLHPHPIDFVPTPEPQQTALPVIGSVRAIGDFDYNVQSLKVEGDLLHLRIAPIRDPERNRLREIWADKQTYELRKLIATDRLFITGGPSYGVTFTVTMGTLDGRPIVTDIHGKVGDGYAGDGVEVDFHFRDIAFPSSLPAWYFDPRTYGAHADDAPL
jgi:hypothetical protein